MKKISTLFLCAFMLLAAAWTACADDGLVGLWRYEYNDHVVLFNFMADGTYQEIISTNDEQGQVMNGKYKVSGNELLITDNAFKGQLIGDFSYTFKVAGDKATLGEYECVRIPESYVEFLLANPYASYTPKTLVDFAPTKALRYLKVAIEQRIPHGYYLKDEDYKTQDAEYLKNDDDVYLLGTSIEQIRGGVVYCFDFSAHRLFGGRAIVFGDGAVVFDSDDTYTDYAYLFPFQIQISGGN